MRSIPLLVQIVVYIPKSATHSYTHTNPSFAVWWEPYHDQSIDDEQRKWAHLPGITDYLVNPHRIREWEDFKSTIRKLESMPINQRGIGSHKDGGQSYDNIKNESSDSRENSSGCLGTLLLTIVAALHPGVVAGEQVVLPPQAAYNFLRTCTVGCS
jgi:hypothetical protein